MNKTKIVLCCFQLTAYKILSVLIDQMHFCPDNILVFVDSVPEESDLGKLLFEKKIIYSTDSIKLERSYNEIKEFNPDYIASVYFREIIPNAVLKCAKKKTFNVHPSLLPKYKGCFSAPWVIINREIETGLTFHEMTAEIDSGMILRQIKIQIKKDDTGFSLYHKLMNLVFEHFESFFGDLIQNKIIPTPMPEGGSLFPRKVPHDGVIDKNWDNVKIEAFIRAMHFPPFKGAVLRLSDGRKIEIKSWNHYKELIQ